MSVAELEPRRENDEFYHVLADRALGDLEIHGAHRPDYMSTQAALATQAILAEWGFQTEVVPHRRNKPTDTSYGNRSIVLVVGDEPSNVVSIADFRRKKCGDAPREPNSGLHEAIAMNGKFTPLPDEFSI